MTHRTLRAAMLGACLAASLAAQPFPAELFDRLEWRLIGPFRAGRVVAVTGVRGDPNTFYFGAVGGGAWKTTNAGMTWTPIFDGQRVSSIGAMEVAPSDPNVIYVGTGEVDIRSDIGFGDGIYKSVDGGSTWTHAGLRDSRHIGRILVHPANPDIVYAAVLGHAYGPNEERGVYRSTDGGRSWRKVLGKGPDVGAVDLASDPESPQIIYAAMWRARRTTWSQYAPLGGPGSGLYRSTDGGDTWTQLAGRGLPESEWGRAGVAVGRGTGARIVYALIEAREGGLFRSDDGGASWTRTSSDPRLTSRGWYFGGITVDPRNAGVVYVPNVALYKSSDGGSTITVVKGAPGGDDYHMLWIDPADSSRMIQGSDQGATVSLDGGKTWSTWYNQPTAQFYHVITDHQFPYYVYGSQQDSGTAAVASRTNHGQIQERDWYSVGGGESGWIAIDPKDPNITYVGNANGTLNRFDKRTAADQNITPWPMPGFGTDISQRKYRFPWTAPLVFSPTEPGTLYYGSQYLLKTTDGGLSWREISPDLTGDERKDNKPLEGPVTNADAKARGYGVIYSIGPSPLKAGLIWVGSDTGLIHLTRDGGKSWSNVTPKGLTDWSKVTHIEASHFDPAEAYAAIDRHRLDDYKPYVYRTRDYGKTWAQITSGIEEPAFLNAIREDPARRGLLFAATETGVYVSFDGGDHWQSLKLNLPAASVRDLVIEGDDLVIGTHGRSFWVLDDIAPLREIDTRVAGADAWFYKPASAIRTSSAGFQGTPLPPEQPTARNPPQGAILDYSFKTAPQGEVTLEILDAKDQVIRRFSTEDPAPSRPRALPVADIWMAPPARLTARGGMNRFVWDLRYALAGAGEGGGFGGPARGPLVLPGIYQARLTAGGRTLTQMLKVALDPRSTATPADLRRQLDLGLKVSREMGRHAQVAAQVQALNRQAGELKSRAAQNAVLLAAGASITSQAESILENLRTARSELNVVLGVVDSADRTPPAQAYALFDQAARNLDTAAARWSALRTGGVAELNRLLQQSNLPTIGGN